MNLRPTQVPDTQRKLAAWWVSQDGWQFAEDFLSTSKDPKAGLADNVQSFTQSMSQLIRAESYWVDREMVALTTMAQATLPDRPLTEEMLPAPDGFAFFDVEDIWRSELDKKRVTYSALHWRVTHDRPARLPDGSVSRTPGIWLCWYVDSDHIERLITRPDLRGKNFYLWRDHLSDMVMTSIEFWPFGETVGTVGVRLDQESEAALGKQLEYTGKTTTHWLRWADAFWELIQQPVTVTARQPLPSPARKRAQRAGMSEDGVQVITLRRPRQQPTGSDPRSVDWSCSWMVDGHWHRYHTNKGMIRRWLTPYVKGPPDKPLKFKEHVYAWRR